jgi:hypothetical protein
MGLRHERTQTAPLLQDFLIGYIFLKVSIIACWGSRFRSERRSWEVAEKTIEVPRTVLLPLFLILRPGKHGKPGYTYIILLGL